MKKHISILLLIVAGADTTVHAIENYKDYYVGPKGGGRVAALRERFEDQANFNIDPVYGVEGTIPDRAQVASSEWIGYEEPVAITPEMREMYTAQVTPRQRWQMPASQVRPILPEDMGYMEVKGIGGENIYPYPTIAPKPSRFKIAEILIRNFAQDNYGFDSFDINSVADRKALLNFIMLDKGFTDPGTRQIALSSAKLDDPVEGKANLIGCLIRNDIPGLSENLHRLTRIPKITVTDADEESDSE